MTGNRTLAGLTLAAGVAVAAAVAAYGGGPAAGGRTAEGPLLPALAERVAETPAAPARGIGRIAVGGGAGAGAGGAGAGAGDDADPAATAVRNAAGGWSVPALAGYPADPAVVDRVVADLAGLTLAEPLTRRPDRFPLLGLGAPAGSGEAGDDATRVTLRDGDGSVAADLWVGDRRPGGVGRQPGHYVRRAAAAEGAAVGRPGEAADGDDTAEPVPAAGRAWLVAGPLDLPRRPVDWIDPTVIDLAPDRIARLTIAVEGAAPVVVVPAEGAAEARARTAGHAVGAFVLAEPTTPALDGRVVERAFRIDNLAGTLDGLDLIDVRPADAVVDRPVAATATAETADGLTVVIETRRDADGTPWLILTARTAADAPPDVTAEAAAIGARTEGWAYLVPAPDADRLAATLDALAEPR